jgi:hypothetical protein
MGGPVLAGVVSALVLRNFPLLADALVSSLLATASSGFALFRFRWSVGMLIFGKTTTHSIVFVILSTPLPSTLLVRRKTAGVDGLFACYCACETTKFSH